MGHRRECNGKQRPDPCPPVGDNVFGGLFGNDVLLLLLIFLLLCCCHRKENTQEPAVTTDADASKSPGSGLPPQALDLLARLTASK